MTLLLISRCKYYLNTHAIAKTAENVCLCFDSNVDKDKIFRDSGIDEFKSENKSHVYKVD